VISARQGEVWDADLDPVVGREQPGTRPVVVISIDTFGAGPSDLVVVVPCTTTPMSPSFHVCLRPPVGGLDRVTYAMPERVRSISRVRLRRRRGWVSPEDVAEISRRVAILIRPRNPVGR
jgi:mRNA interferase MazF